MRILAFDTALGACSAAISVDGTIVARRHEYRTRGHVEALLPMVEAVRLEAGLDYGDIDVLAVTVGPGTFTGVRIGLSAARGLALALGKPLIGVTTLEAVAAAATNSQMEPVLCVLDARRGEVYAQAFTADLEPITEPRVLPPAEIGNLAAETAGVLVGSGAELVHPFLPGHHVDPTTDPDAALVARRATLKLSEEPRPTLVPSPLYLRRPDAKLPGAAE